MLAAALTALTLLVSGCGQQPTGHGAPPFHEASPSDTAPHIRTHYPAVDARFKLPALAGPDLAPVEAFIKFEVAVLRALKDNTIGPNLKKYTSKPVRTLVRAQVTFQQRYSVSSLGPYKIDIRSVDTIQSSLITACVRDANRLQSSTGSIHDGTDKASGITAIVQQRKSGTWYVAAVGDGSGGKGKKLKHCS